MIWTRKTFQHESLNRENSVTFENTLLWQCPLPPRIPYHGLYYIKVPFPPSSRSVTHGDEEDDDVVQETKRVMTGGAKDDMLVVKGLSKYYRSGMHSVRAVDHVSLGIPRGDVSSFELFEINKWC